MSFLNKKWEVFNDDGIALTIDNGEEGGVVSVRSDTEDSKNYFGTCRLFLDEKSARLLAKAILEACDFLKSNE